MKKISKRVLITITAALVLGLLAACGVGANSIERVAIGTQETNGVNMTNYTVYLKDTVNWSALSDKDREKLAVIGFEEAQKKIAEDGTHSGRYNINGITPEKTMAFQYDGENKVMAIYLDGKPTGATVAVTPPEE
jgi:hypothetical protein